MMRAPSRIFVILDAARDITRVALAKLVAPKFASLFSDPKGDLDDIAPHLFQSDDAGVAIQFPLGRRPAYCGLIVECDSDFDLLRRHLRRFLRVRRESDRKIAHFRYYDPRVLQVFLPACNDHELGSFFGPIRAFHCQGDDPGTVLTFTLERGRLRTCTAAVQCWLQGLQGRAAEPAISCPA